MANLIKMTIQVRRDTAVNWELYKDKIPAAGEPCFVLDKNILKIGDGETPFKDLPEIGGVNFNVDDNTLEMEDGVLKLLGFGDAEVGAQPRKNADGKIEWAKPSTETVDDLKSDITNIQTNITEIQQIIMPSEEGEGTLLDRVENLESEVNTLVSGLTPDGKVNTMMELIAYVESHGQEAADMASDIQTLQGLVNDMSSKAIKEVAVNGTLLDIVDGRVNIVIPEFKSSDEITVNEDGTLSIKSISFDKIAQVEDNEIVLNGGGAAG